MIAKIEKGSNIVRSDFVQLAESGQGKRRWPITKQNNRYGGRKVFHSEF